MVNYGLQNRVAIITGANNPDLISAAETLITERIKEE